FDKGISWEGDLIDMAMEDRLVEKSGAFFTIGDAKIQGREKAKEFLRENPAVADDLRAKVLAKRGLSAGGPAAHSADEDANGVLTEDSPAPKRRGKQVAAE